jgi:hypothetical protein
MVFMGVDGLEGNKPLGSEADRDIAEMKKVGSRGRVNIFVQRHGKDGARRFHIGKGEWKVSPEESKVEDGSALQAFMKWSLDLAHRNDDYTMLVLWGHSYRFSIGHTQTRAGIDAIDFAELATVLKKVQQSRKAQGRPAPRLDIVGFDACDVSSIEMSEQLQPYARYLLSSQIGIPLPGWPYDRILKRLRKPFGRLMGPAEFGSFVVRRFCEYYHAPEGRDSARNMTVSLTLLDLKRISEAAARVEVLALRLATAIRNDRHELESAIDIFRRSQTLDRKPFIDVAQLCLHLVRNSGDVLVRKAAQSVGNLLLSPPPSKTVMKSVAGARRAFVADHGRNSALTANLNGVNLYAPHVAPGHDWVSAKPFYEKFTFVQRTLWSTLVHALVQKG